MVTYIVWTSPSKNHICCPSEQNSIYLCYPNFCMILIFLLCTMWSTEWVSCDYFPLLVSLLRPIQNDCFKKIKLETICSFNSMRGQQSLHWPACMTWLGKIYRQCREYLLTNVLSGYDWFLAWVELSPKYLTIAKWTSAGTSSLSTIVTLMRIAVPSCWDRRKSSWIQNLFSYPTQAIKLMSETDKTRNIHRNHKLRSPKYASIQLSKAQSRFWSLHC
jgi:hypothetical protein